MSILFPRFSVSRLSFVRCYSSSIPPSRPSYNVLRGVLLATSLGAAYTIGSLYPPTLATYISPRPALPPPSPDTPESIAYIAALEKQLLSLPIIDEHRSRQDSDDWYEIRPYTDYPEERRVNHLTAGVLRGPGKLALRPLIRAKRDESEAWVFLHLGRALCGHDGIVHGGLIATVLDEATARTAFFNLPKHIAVTANLTVNYRAPTKADQFIVIKTRLLEQKGRKAIVAAQVEDMSGNVLQEATAVFVQPKYANLLNKDILNAAAGIQKDNVAVVPSS